MRPRVTVLMSCAFLLLALPEPPVCAEPRSMASEAAPAFGRLFNTPEQRQALDARRRRDFNGEVTPMANDVAIPRARMSTAEPVRLSGIMIRADGQQSLWINGKEKRLQRSSKSQRVIGDPKNSASVKIPLQNTVFPPGARVSGVLKPGQVWLPGKPAQEGYNSAVGRPVAPVSEPEPTLVPSPVPTPSSTPQPAVAPTAPTAAPVPEMPASIPAATSILKELLK